MAEQQQVQPALAGERRIVTILFCDVKGSTAMAEKLDPEQWAGIMNRAYEHLIAPVSRHGGTVAQLLGDAILAYFGAPVSHEDDPQRAVLAGLEIIAGIGSFREQLQKEGGPDFNVRVGINTGLVMAGQIGSGQRVTYTAVGDAVNLAARMEQTAGPGTVQITAETYRLIAPLFECESLGQIEVKGKSKPIQTYRVHSLKRNPSQVSGFEMQGFRSLLVGRNVEFTAANRCLEELVQGQGNIVGIIGEAGLGKSRLVAEAKSVAVARRPNLLWLEGQTLSFGQTISYWPFQQMLRGWAGITGEDDADTTWSKLEQRVRALLRAESIDYLPYLASLLALDVRGEYAERVRYLDGEAMSKQIFLTSRRFFECLARAQPTVLVFEDLHWMDESSTLLLQHLLPLVETVPLVIFGISRPERDTPAARLRELCMRDFTDHYTEIRLAPLSESESAELIDNLLDIESMPARLREVIVDKADGNPFFLEEVIRTFMDAGAVKRDASSGRWRATAQIESIQIPNTIQGVIMARVDRLDEELKQVLRVASVIGRSFLYRVLKAMAEAGPRLDDDLTELQASEFIREKQHVPELEYIFKHALAQEATYESILLARRRELHARAAQTIESLFSERLEEFYGLLAYHYARAEAWHKAQDYLLKAADQAGQIAADAEALNLYEQAMSAYARAFGDTWDPLQRAALERKMGEAFFRRGEHKVALDYLQRGLRYLGHPLPASRWGVHWALLMELVQQVGHRCFPPLFLKNIPQGISPAAEEELHLYELIGSSDVFSNRERTLLDAIRGLNRAEQYGIRYGVAGGYAAVGYIATMASLFHLGRSYHQNGVNLAKQVGHKGMSALSHHTFGIHLRYAGDLASAIEHEQIASKTYREIGDLTNAAATDGHIAHILFCRGDFARSVEICQDWARLGREAALPFLEGYQLIGVGRVELVTGQIDAGIADLQEASRLIVDDPLSHIECIGWLAWGYLRNGNLPRALAELNVAQRFWTENRPYGHYNTPFLNTCVQAYLVAAEQGENLERIAWLKQADSASKRALKQANAFYPGKPEAMRLRGIYEWLAGRAATAQEWWQKSQAEAKKMGMRYEMGMTDLEVGQRLGAREHLEQAEAIFAEIGAELDLEKARELLRP